MSIIRRIISGSLASWSSLLFTLIIQISLVPLYLVSWDKDTYALWIAILSLSSILTILDKTFQNYLGNEFLILGNSQKLKLSKLLSSGIFVAFNSGFLQIIITILFDYFNFSRFLVSDSNLSFKDFEEAESAIVIFSFSWFLTGNLCGILTRSLIPFGYYSRIAWWSFFNLTLTNLLPLLALFFTKRLIFIAIFMSMGSILFDILIFNDVFKIIKNLKIRFRKPSIKISIKIVKSSLVLTVSNLLISLRQEGLRLILAPLFGSKVLVSFTTTRTGANLALQGLNTISNPILPELMNFLKVKNQEKSEIMLATIWTILIFVLTPAVIILQFIMPSVFEIWTLGKIEYNSILFALLSFGVLIFALAQPAISITKGNNDIKSQLFISIISTAVVIITMLIFVSLLGLVGAGISIVCGELIGLFLYQISAIKWLKANNLNWPSKTYNFAFYSLIIALMILLMVVYSTPLNSILIILLLVIYILNAIKFYVSLPYLLREKFMLSKLLKKYSGN